MWWAAAGSAASCAWFVAFLTAALRDDVQRLGADLSATISALLTGLTSSRWLRRKQL
jgi:hypothetical protein